MKGKTFASRFISKLEKIDPKQIESFLTQLTQERDFLQVVLNSLREGIIVTDPDFRVLFLNDSAINLLGLSSRRAILGEFLLGIIRQRNLNEAIAGYDIERRKLFEREIHVTVPARRIYLLSIIPITNELNEVGGVVFLISDVTVTRKREQDKIKEDRLTSLATLVAGVAHEIKNPLNSLNIHAQLLKRNMGKNSGETMFTLTEFERMRQSTNVILEETDRLSRIVDQFIHAVRPAKPSMRLGNVNRVINKLLETLLPEFDKREIELTLSLEPELPDVFLDEQQLFQAFRNVMKNALEALTPDERPGRIEISTVVSDGEIIISIIDNGCGIEKKDLAKIFEPYYTTKFGGSGLGLMIVYRVVKEHNGDISIESKPGEGTMFTITLPIAKKRIRLLSEKTGKLQHET